MKVESAGNKGRRPSVKSGQRTDKPRKDAAATQAVFERAYALVREIWAIERWRSSVAARVSAYIQSLAEGRRVNQNPTGIPSQVRDLVRRCIAQACLESGVSGLTAQDASWYPAAAEAARKHLK